MTYPSQPPRKEDILFLDIETVPLVPDWNKLDPEWQSLWLEKSRFNRERKQLTPEASYEEAGIYAEFGKIICISYGYFNRQKNKLNLTLHSLCGDNEPALLEAFAHILADNWKVLCAHNGKEFDFPYLCRRYITHSLELPRVLNLAGKKPWENPHLDTLEMWKFGDYKHYSSLRLLAKLLSLPTPKDDIDGSMVREVYYKDNDIDRIERYCRKDVLTVARVYCRLTSGEEIDDDHVDWGKCKHFDFHDKTKNVPA